MKSLFHPLWLLLPVVLWLLSACDTGSHLTLLKPGPHDDRPEIERLRQMQMVRVIDQSDPANPVRKDDDPTEFAKKVASLCGDELRGDDQHPNQCPDTACVDPSCRC